MLWKEIELVYNAVPKSVLPLRHLTHVHLGWKSYEAYEFYIGGGVK